MKCGKWEKGECVQRHPKPCRWDQSNSGCKRGVKCYLHADMDIRMYKKFKDKDPNAMTGQKLDLFDEAGFLSHDI